MTKQLFSDQCKACGLPIKGINRISNKEKQSAKPKHK